MISFIDGYYGWLGNQMFQYAATKALALHLNDAAMFPRNRPDLHSIFRLAAADQRTQQPDMIYREPHFHFDSKFWELKPGTCLSGYFQSWRYFEPFADVIRKEFVFAEHLVFDHPCVVSIHVRRGDYLSFPEHHPPLTMDYYRRAMEMFPAARFLVFTDDPGWCLVNFDRKDCQIRTNDAPEIDMGIMTDCQHHIIANSSFSWWGAYLGRNPNKRVIAPKAWFGPAKAGWDTKDLLPEGWEVM